MKVRKATLKDLKALVAFTSEEAREAGGSVKIPETLEKGIRAALEDNAIAIYSIASGGSLFEKSSAKTFRLNRLLWVRISRHADEFE